MQVLIILNFFLLALVLPNKKQALLFNEALSFVLYVAPARVLIILLSFFFLTSHSFLGIDYSSTYVLSINVLSYIFLFLLSYKILMKSLIRNSELVSRFILDSLPGEQLSVDIAKRDGIYSSKEALMLRADTVVRSLGVASAESKLKILSYEPVVVLLLSLGFVLVNIFYNNLGFSENIPKINQILFASNLSLFSIVLTTIIIFKSINSYKDFQSEGIVGIFKSKSKILSAYLFSFALIAFGLSLVTRGASDALGTTWLIFSSSILLYARSLFLSKKEESIVFKLNISSGVFTKAREASPTIFGSNDLLIFVGFSKNLDENQSQYKDVFEYLRINSLILEPVDSVVIVFDKGFKSSKIKVSWRENELEFDEKELKLNNTTKAAFYFARKLMPLLFPHITKFHLYAYIKKNALSSSYFSSLSQLSLDDLQNSYELVLDLMKKGVFIDNAGMFIFNALNESDGFLKNYISRNIDQMYSADGVARVVFIKDSDNLEEQIANLESIISKVRQRGISPLIISSEIDDLPESFKWFSKECIILDSKLIPENLSYFPLSSL